MTPLIALLLAAVAPAPSVTGLSVSALADRTEVVIMVDGTVSARDFMLDDGRIVIDVTGVPQVARLDLSDFNRGGIRELRVAQFQPNVARIVIRLAGPLAYDVQRDAGSIRVSFPNRDGAFEPWSRAFGAGTAAGPDPAADAARLRPVLQQPQAQQLQPQQPQRQPPINVTFDNWPLTAVLGLFSDYAGRTILAAPDVQARAITAELRGVPWDQALEAILEANNMVMRQLTSGVLLVEDFSRAGARQREEPTVTEAFSINFINADSIRLAIMGLLTPDVGRVTVNRASNSLIVTDIRSSVDRIREILPQLDTRTPQVDISAVIAFIDRTTLEAMGIVYDLKDSRGNQINRMIGGYVDRDGDGRYSPDEATREDVVLLGGNSIGALGNANYRMPAPSLEIVTSLILGRHTLISFIEALQTVNLSDIQAKPMIRTMDNRTASIQVGEETPIRVLDAGAPGGTGQQQQQPLAMIEMKNTGVILEVTPHITGNQVLLDLRAERSNVAAAPSDIGLIFQTQNATTQVLVNDGETAVIGGLTIIEKTRSRSGIPLLMDLPVIGALFRQEIVRENKRDLLIMVTPHIVRD
jgi:type IV pilus assembly protein PilQ